MRFITLILFLSLFVASTGQTIAQNENGNGNINNNNKEENKEENKDIEYEDWDIDYWDITPSLEIEIPTIELQFGPTTPKYHEDVFTGSLRKLGIAEIRLGHSEFKKMTGGIIKYEFSYLFLGNISDEYISGDIANGMTTVNAWRFGFSESKGYGYRFGDFSSLVFYNTNGMGWTKLDFNYRHSGLVEEQNLTPSYASYSKASDLFGDQFRFGDQFEGGVRLRLFDLVAVNAAYEKVIVFPRHMFWYWALGEVVEGAGHGIINGFVRSVLSSKPYVVPVVNFILQNGFSYGLYQLRTKNMNWPTETVPPFEYEIFKIGVTFTL